MLQFGLTFSICNCNMGDKFYVLGFLVPKRTILFFLKTIALNILLETYAMCQLRRCNVWLVSGMGGKRYEYDK